MTAAKKIVTVLIALLAVFCFCFLEQTFAFCFSRVYGRKGGQRLIILRYPTLKVPVVGSNPA